MATKLSKLNKERLDPFQTSAQNYLVLGVDIGNEDLLY